MNNQIRSKQTYECVIDELQRELLVRALKAVLNNHTIRSQFEAPAFDDGPESEGDELRAFLDMLEDLPEHERDHPGVTHGLCL